MSQKNIISTQTQLGAPSSFMLEHP